VRWRPLKLPDRARGFCRRPAEDLAQARLALEERGDDLGIELAALVVVPDRRLGAVEAPGAPSRATPARQASAPAPITAA